LKKIIFAIFCWPVYLYKYLISPLLPKVCRFKPTCSTYFIQAVKMHGVVKGSALGIYRILRCTPRCKHTGYDPVPLNIKGESKWVL